MTKSFIAARIMPYRNIPLFYRLWHLYLEPLFAISGAYYLHFAPALYHNFMPRSTNYNASSQIVYDQLASSYLFFAFVEGVLLRVVDNLRMWRWIVAALLLCDVGHCYAAWCEIGTDGLLDLSLWTGEVGVANLLTVLPLFTRLAFVMGVGMGGEREGKWTR